jgi:hypothetical protein
MSAHTSSSSNPAVVGVHYQVGKKIGEGSFGVVFEGPHTILVHADHINSLVDLMQGLIYSTTSQSPSNSYVHNCGALNPRWLTFSACSSSPNRNPSVHLAILPLLKATITDPIILIPFSANPTLLNYEMNTGPIEF